MHSAKNYLIGLLALTTIAGAIVAWQQQRELAALRAAALQPNERAEWQKRLWAAEKRRGELEERIERAAGSRDGGPELDRATESPSGNLRSGGRGFNGARFAAMMDQPEVQRLMAVQQKAGLDSRYAPLFKRLGLRPDQLEKFKNLLVEKSTAMMDVMMAAREQGINPRQDPDAFRQLVDGTQAEIDASIRGSLGETAFAEYQKYEQTLPQRTIVDQLEQRLSYSSTPLTAAQGEQLVSLLATSGTPAASGPLDGFGPAGHLGGRGQASITEEALQKSAGVLAAAQLEALRQLQQEQQAQRELGAAFRNQLGGAHPASPAGTATTPAASPPPPPNNG